MSRNAPEHGTSLSDIQEKAARLLAAATPIPVVAKECNRKVRQIYRWQTQGAFIARLEYWRERGAEKFEAKQEKLADMQAGIAQAEQAAYSKALEKLNGALDSEEPKILLGAIREARECFMGSKDSKPDVQIASLLAAINAGGGMRHALDMPLVTHEVTKREEIH